MLPIGDMIPDWQGGVSTSAKSLLNLDAPIQPTLRYRVLQTDPKTGKQRRVKMYHKLVIAKDADGKIGGYVVFFVASNQYSRNNKGIISDWFNNDGKMNGFSGLKIYTSLEGHILRVNKYINGNKVRGIFLGE